MRKEFIILPYILCSVFFLFGQVEKDSLGQRPTWIVETIYPVLSVEHDETTVTVRWRFTVVDIVQREEGAFWQVRVADDDGVTPDECEFLLDPEDGFISSITIREFRRGKWREYYSLTDESKRLHIQSYGAPPLDYAWMGMAGRDGEKRRDLTWEQAVTVGNVHRFRKTYKIRTERESNPLGQGKSLLSKYMSSEIVSMQIQDFFNPKRTWEMVWEYDFPWWSACRTNAYTARIASINGELTHE